MSRAVNPLMVVMSVRDFKPAWYWINKVDFLDKLIVKYWPHNLAHEKARKFFLEHPEYTHLLIYAEDIMATPDMVKLLIKDAEEHDFPVVSGYSNYDLRHYDVNITDRDLTNVRVFSAHQYKFYTLYDVLSGRLGWPFKQVFFVGLPLTLIRRDVVEKIEFKPYRVVVDRTLGVRVKRGWGFDLQFAINCKKMGIPIIVDLRLLCLHFGDTRRFINIRDKRPYVKFIPKNGKEVIIEQGPAWGV